ncbi:MAG: glycosyltransferase family 39 protein [Bacteroidales bacterium]|nr:glycosyltransferase family 39 protein [Bacteroidales bacterium]MCF8455284.1 glycosyltransferase family 39 protein [Bacteroidales bacterium]
MAFLKKYQNHIILLAALVAFVLFKIPHLSLPYYWDEAWVYGPAVRLMAQNGLGLLPDALPVHYSRGHPLLFHFLVAAWLQLFGNTVLMSHVFALVVSILLVVALYFVGKDLFDQNIALVSVLLLLMQPIFLAQSGLVLPEVMLALFALLSVFFFLKKKMTLYFISATLMLFTKETGVAIVFVAFMLEIVRQKGGILSQPWKTIKTLFVVGSPVLVLFAYLLVQYFYQGWFLFPEHTGFVTFDIATVWNRLTEGYGAYIFIYQGRNLLLFSALVLLVYALIRKVKLDHKTELFALFAFIVGFMLVSSVNFFSNRYTLTVVVLFLVLSTGIILQVLKNKYLAIGFTFIALALQIPILQKKSGSDHNLGYVNAVKANIAMTDYISTLQIQDKEICANFNTMEILRNPLCGYVDEGTSFKNLVHPFNDETDYCIISNYDTPKADWDLAEKNDLKLMQRFEMGQAWIAIYQNTTK